MAPVKCTMLKAACIMSRIILNKYPEGWFGDCMSNENDRSCRLVREGARGYFVGKW